MQKKLTIYRLNETIPRKRVTLSLRLPANAHNYVETMPLWVYFLRFTDKLVANAHFRPEIMRKIKAVREDEIRRIAKIANDEEAENRKQTLDKEKKEKREAMLKSMSAAEQKKFLDKEREKEMKRSQKKMTLRS